MKPAADSAGMSPAPNRLAEIRALEQEDLPQMAELFEVLLGSGVRAASPATIDFFRRTLFDNPWTDPGLKSLVAVDERARPIGFIGAEPRRLRIADRMLRAVVGAHLVVEPAARHLAVGALLLRQLLQGTQDLTLTDSASETARTMWEAFGGHTLHLKGIHWVRVFRPWRVAAHLLASRGRPRLSTLWPAAVALDAATMNAGARYLEPTRIQETVAKLTPRTLLEALPGISRRLTLYPDYDEPFLEWLFRELGHAERGELVARCVCAASGQPIGWFVYLLRPGWRSEVLQVAASRNRIGSVLDQLFRHAYTHGSAALRGRLEPGIVEAVVSRRCLLWHRGGALAHSTDPELLCALYSERSLVTRLEGEWWVDALV